MNINVDVDGTMLLSNDRTTVSIKPDGTIELSSMDPVILTGACAAKLDNAGDQDTIKIVTDALLRRIEKPTKDG